MTTSSWHGPRDISGVFEQSAATWDGTGAPPPDHDYWYGELMASNPAGAHVTHERALRVTTVLACVKAIAESMATLPLGIFSRQENGDKEALHDHPLHELLHDQANDEHTAAEFRALMQTFVLMRGTAVAEIIPGRRSAVGQLVPLWPDWVRFIPVRNSRPTLWQVEYREPGAPVRRLNRDEVFVVRGLGFHQAGTIEGMDPIMCERDAIGAAMATQDYAARFFANDATPPLMIEWPDGAKRFRDEEEKLAFQRRWQAARTGANRHKTAVLEHGMKVHQLTLSNEQAQYLETRKHQDIDICKIFRVPPHKAGILADAKYANIEQQAIEWVTDTLMPWLVGWEQAIKRDLIARTAVFAEHNVTGLLRGDIKARFDAYAQARNWGWLSVNDIRRFENMNGIGEEGDVYLQPLNMVEAGAEPAPEPAPAPMGPDQDARLPRAIAAGMRKEGALWTPTN